jgi:hypothetical protein
MEAQTGYEWLRLLSAEEILECRQLWRAGSHTRADLAAHFGVGIFAIAHVITREDVKAQRRDTLAGPYQRPNDMQARGDLFPMLLAAPTDTVDPTSHEAPALRAIIEPRSDETWIDWRCRVNDQLTALAERLWA